MDDIQIWLYIIFGIFYFVSRILKKKKPETPNNSETSESPQPEKRPMSFEDLLKEITEDRKVDKSDPPAPVVQPVVKETKRYESAAETIKREEEERKEEFLKEGETRHFADEESKAIYERSVKMAKDNAGEFKSFDQFTTTTSKMQRTETVQENSVATELKSMLQNKQDVKKAIILNEILARKY